MCGCGCDSELGLFLCDCVIHCIMAVAYLCVMFVFYHYDHHILPIIPSITTITTALPPLPVTEHLPPVEARLRVPHTPRAPQTARPAESLSSGAILPPASPVRRANTSHATREQCCHASGALTARPTTHAYQQMRAPPSSLRVGAASRGGA